jgi:hypothetical protein
MSQSPSVQATGAIDADRLLEMSPAALDELFRASPAGEAGSGRSRGTVLFFPGTEVAKPFDRFASAVIWQGKVFDAQRHDLKNLVTPWSVPAVRAEVYTEDSWYDHRPCTVLDYSRSSRLFGWIRDEIREVSPGVFLGIVWGVGRAFGGRRRILRFVLTFPRGS